MIIIGIETSCDETAAAVVKAEKGKIEILSNVVSSQVKLHAKWGGVVPNLAAREHLKNILPIIKTSLKESGKKPEDLDLIAVTNGPGLIPALLIGTTTAKTLSYLWKKPLMGIHHIEGHIYANFLQTPHPPSPSPSRRGWHEVPGEDKIKFPALCLVVSGGHTQLVLMKKHLDYEIVGETLDDAAGEAFDKVARILNLGYPGGPVIAKASAKFPKNKPEAISYKLSLPRPMLDHKDFNFSFSGLKTAVLYLVKKNEDKIKDPEFIQAVAHEFQQAVVDVLIGKTIQATKKYNPKTIMLAGGVSANLELRRQLGEVIKKDLPAISYNLPALSYSIDNAIMIATAAHFRWEKAKNKNTYRNSWKTLKTDAALKL